MGELQVAAGRVGGGRGPGSIPVVPAFKGVTDGDTAGSGREPRVEQLSVFMGASAD